MKNYILSFLLLANYVYAKDARTLYQESQQSQTNDQMTTLEKAEDLKFKLMRELFMMGGHKLNSQTGCQDFVKSKQDTVDRFIARNLSYFSPNQANSISAKCEQSDVHQLCSVEFHADSKGESPWSCGLRFLFDFKLQKIRKGTFECIGTC